MIVLVIAAVFAVLYVVSRRRDARLLRNGVFLVAAIFLGLVGLALVLQPVWPGVVGVVNGVLAVVALSIPVLGVALIGNGVTMLKSEGRSLGNLLSLLAGFALFVLPALALLLFRFGTVATGLALFLGLASLYIGLAFVTFAVYSVVYGRIRKRVVPAVVVILGSGLIDGRVPPLLRSRLDRAVGLYDSEGAAGRRPLLIPSGGQGADEPRPEGEAMAEYLVSQGVPAFDIRAETVSRSTRENLFLSRAVQDEANRPGEMLVVTNNYHVLRTALLARSIGSEAQVIGSRTAAYYVPSAFLREFIAVMVEHRWLNALAIASFLALIGAGIWESFQMR